MSNMVAVPDRADLAMQAHNLSIRVEERVVAVEKRQDRHEAEVQTLRKDMIDSLVRQDAKLDRSDAKLDKISNNVNTLVIVGLSSSIVMLLGALGAVIWWMLERGFH